jgi:CHAT domain-containing protein
VGVDVSSLRSRDLEGAALKPLPGTQIEVEEISSLLEKQRWQAQVYTREHALKEAVMEVKGPRVLHLATHGFFEPDEQKSDQAGKAQSSAEDQPPSLEDPMLRSGLYFAGANRRLSRQATPADLDDGVLTAYEASQIDLQGTELVVLSACETGLGEVAAGEGVFGLRRALQVAGADSVLMSMWAVPDKETQELMALFYEKWLADEDKHVALTGRNIGARSYLWGARRATRGGLVSIRYSIVREVGRTGGVRRDSSLRRRRNTCCCATRTPNCSPEWSELPASSRVSNLRARRTR